MFFATRTILLICQRSANGSVCGLSNKLSKHIGSQIGKQKHWQAKMIWISALSDLCFLTCQVHCKGNSSGLKGLWDRAARRGIALHDTRPDSAACLTLYKHCFVRSTANLHHTCSIEGSGQPKLNKFTFGQWGASFGHKSIMFEIKFVQLKRSQ